ncbi:hypothetical protein TRFO_12138 [Tritrichomonas foetus]|uniref:Importin N-terminal domain-containing protein n=1 Tax=Tritrichomonas foetus TaxID=1144522 RepID=A0A1J4J0M5_9EUKA|nr:hypothetical protein TRFO_12138 [Tritrichomonas foetus]|eukprot:OHS92954.1 hypothetical protein TRFO_12138 [Tritrichomonas foetus]
MNSNPKYLPLSEDLILMGKRQIPLPEGIDSLLVITSLGNTKNFESFHWCLSNLHNFRSIYAREFSLRNIYNFITSSWIQIPVELYPILADEFFTFLFQDPNYLEQSFMPLIFKSQNLIAQELYPKYLPDFFTTLLSFPKDRLYGFLRTFNFSLYDEASMHSRNITEMLNNCLADGSQARILETIVNDVLAGVEQAKDPLVSTVEWVSLSLLLNSQLLELFAKLLTQAETCSLGLKIFYKIFNRSISLDYRIELVNAMHLLKLIHEIVKNSSENEEILVLATKLMYCATNKLTLTNLAPEILELALNLFMIPNKETTSLMYNLINLLFNSNSHLIPQCFPSLMAKIANTVSLQTADADLILQNSLRAFVNASMKTNCDVVSQLMSLASDLNLSEKIVEAASLIAALNVVLSSFDEETISPIILSIVQQFSPLLVINPPFIPAHFIALSNYLSMIKPVLPLIDPPFRAQVFIACMNLINSESSANSAPCDRQNLIEAVRDVCEAIPQLIIQIPYVKSNLLQFIQSGEHDLMKAGSFLISVLTPEERFEMYNKCLEIFSIMIGQNIKIRINSILDFWTVAKTDDLPQIYSSLTNFFVALINSNRKISDQKFTTFIQATIQTLGIDAFHIFWNSPEITTFENAAIIIQAAMPLSQLPSDDPRLGQIFQLIKNVYKLKSHSKQIKRKSDEVLSMEQFYICAANFLILIIPKLNPESQNSALFYLIQMMVNLQLPAERMNQIVLFLLTSPESVVNEIDAFFETFLRLLKNFSKHELENYGELLFNLIKLLRILFVLVPDMSWEHPRWSKIENLRGNGPQKLVWILTCDENLFVQAATEFLEDISPKKIGADDEFQADDEDCGNDEN